MNNNTEKNKTKERMNILTTGRSYQFHFLEKKQTRIKHETFLYLTILDYKNLFKFEEARIYSERRLGDERPY